MENHRLYTDSDDTDDESWAPEDHGDEEGDDSYASDDDEAGGNEGKDVSDDNDTLDAPKTANDRLFSMSNKKERQNATKSRLYQTASQASRFGQVNALCRDQMLPLEDALDMYLRNAGGDMEELLLDPDEGKRDNSEDEDVSTAAFFKWDIARWEEMDKLVSTIVKGTEELQEKRERTLSDTRDNDMEHSSSLVIPRIRKKLKRFQIKAIEWLEKMFTKACHCVLNAKKGCGSLEIVTSFLDNLAYGKCQSWGAHLIVVPSYSVDLWAVYLKQFCPGLKTVTFSPNKKRYFT